MALYYREPTNFRVLGKFIVGSIKFSHSELLCKLFCRFQSSCSYSFNDMFITSKVLKRKLFELIVRTIGIKRYFVCQYK